MTKKFQDKTTVEETHRRRLERFIHEWWTKVPGEKTENPCVNKNVNSITQQ